MRLVKPDGPHIYTDRMYRDQAASIAVGSAEWYAWLSAEGNRAFVFRNEAGDWHQARREERRGRFYWYVACRVAGRVRRFYLGPAAALDVARLGGVAAAIAAVRAGKEEQ
jgi:hypothetical protein